MLFMDPRARFTQKAIIYDKYRWDYSPQAIEAMINIANVSPRAHVADIGAGTGILTRHLISRVQRVFAIEPNPEMRRMAGEVLGVHQVLRIIDGSAEATGLRRQCVDLIVVGRAIHWFQCESARKEFLRILRPGGWLAILQVPCADDALLNSIRSIQIIENGWNVEDDKNHLEKVPLGFYYGKEGYRTFSYPGVVHESWDEFFGRLSSISSAPDESHELYKNFASAARKIFENHARHGRITIRTATELNIGKMTPD